LIEFRLLAPSHYALADALEVLLGLGLVRCEREPKEEIQLIFCQSASLSDRSTGDRQSFPLGRQISVQATVSITICEGMRYPPLKFAKTFNSSKPPLAPHWLMLLLFVDTSFLL
jgi:hypothetical protein